MIGRRYNQPRRPGESLTTTTHSLPSWLVSEIAAESQIRRVSKSRVVSEALASFFRPATKEIGPHEWSGTTLSLLEQVMSERGQYAAWPAARVWAALAGQLEQDQAVEAYLLSEATGGHPVALVWLRPGVDVQRVAEAFVAFGERVPVEDQGGAEAWALILGRKRGGLV